MTAFPSSSFSLLGLSGLEQDALLELINLGVGRAATNLSRMLDEHVVLSVPKAEIQPLTAAADALWAREQKGLVAVEQVFSGAFSGSALLIFPERKSLELVRAIIGPAPPVDEIGDLEQEALTEIGNVILNGCLAIIANTLGGGLRISLPTLLRGDGRAILLSEREPKPDELVLFLYIDFVVRSRNLHGYIALLMDLPSLEGLKALIQAFIANIGIPGRLSP
ncbi:chemotaxis protein CheX [Arenibaculum pallidiluteum]|uniref:chemotaxis protein CheX n=1 Tax=Arenibaculum pallidiluteum TaxID=2812559 RepID=UPI001F18F852|nr:chemotaxis protein CheX [Arenibaculum pallidiluteum]